MAIPIGRILVRALAAACLLIISALGTLNGVDELNSWGASTVLQQSVTISSLIYGVIGIAAGVGVLLRRRWGYFLSLAWGVVLTYTGGMASHAYGETSAQLTAVAAAGTALIAGIVIWLANLTAKIAR